MRVLVVGAGVFGSWCAKHLAGRGYDVTLVDAYGPANGRASSADHSRVIRCGYGADAIYSQWARDAWRDWEALERIAGQRLLTQTGALFLGPPGSTYIRDTFATLGPLQIDVEAIDPQDLKRRFPQIEPQGLGTALFEPRGGVIRARRAVRALVEHLGREGVTYQAQCVAPLDEQRSNCSVRTVHGATLEADAFVFAAGPWLPTLLPHTVADLLRVTKQEVLYFGVPAGESQFSYPRLPLWIDFSAGVYGIPDIDSHGFKVGIDRHGERVDPDTLERVIDPKIVSTTRDWMAGRFPLLSDAPLVDAHVCQYENTSSGDFIIDRHPVWSNCWIVGGGSGHGFKHGPSVGRHVAALVAGETTPEPRFSLVSKTTVAARAVY